MIHHQETRDGVSVTFLQGVLDLQTSRDFTALFDDFQKKGCRNIVLDLADVSFIDSQSLSLIITQAIQAREEGGNIRFSRVPPRLMRVFELVGLHDVLEFFDDVDSAVQAFSRSSPEY
ncbi:MAG TPA: STAS domain-containing protein [Candidatus Ozemobacteraceae bacterium]|nr:STAS domain-containing protein [Candidatus Ozemobacteraceae bacterium]HQG28610.1 STAS domain-containing protein [Candidatus Ozemobacteraceae bacterium]